ncbi:hypothetical protein PLANPX_1891 [Lacipirellula parvula]|uniref:Na+-translocating membrane potential-generating system MpsC domain-containing protein n=1 Tax=Lacipirellula parvula TaxID=2650471 RepID=A0A5K7XH46_9BACT|nr:hypothetical protein PLANPX_1891 [Lacipirellula parvula]
MPPSELSAAEQIAQLAKAMQQQRTGYAPKAVTVVMGEDTLVVTLLDALSPAEKTLAQTPEGMAQVQEYHRRLFASSDDEMRREIARITGREVREAAAEVDTSTGTVIHAFTSGAMVQVYLLAPPVAGNEVQTPAN